MDWLTPALGTIVASLITFIGTQWVVRRKAVAEGAAQHVAGVNTATKLLIDSLFQQISALTAEVSALKVELVEVKASRDELIKQYDDHIKGLLSRLNFID